MSILHAIILGIIEGITEFLPISSTGHLILSTRILGITPTPFVESFEIFIQVGALLAVMVLYATRLIKEWSLIKKIAIAFIPTAILGLLLYPFIKEYLLSNTRVVIWALLVGGILIIVFELWYKYKKNTGAPLTNQNAFLLGLFQTLAFIPGVSRSGAMIIAGLGLNMSRKEVVEFSFLLGIPTLIAASGLDMVKSGFMFSHSEYLLLVIGFLTAFVTALVAIKTLLRFIEHHTFIGFGIYRIIIALLLLLLL